MSQLEKLLIKLQNETISAKDARTLLAKEGWELIRTRGSHEHYSKNGKVLTLSPHGKELKKYQIRQIKMALEV